MYEKTGSSAVPEPQEGYHEHTRQPQAGMPRHALEDNIRLVLKGKEYGGMEQTPLAKDITHCQALVNIAITLQDS